jgi:L-ascorbate peroxidase
MALPFATRVEYAERNVSTFAAVSEASARAFLVDLMPLEHTPAHLRLVFHDAGSYDAATGRGGMHAAIRLPEQLRRAENAGWARTCFELLGEARGEFPELSWADLIALGGTAAVERAGGPAFDIGLGRTDADESLPEHQLPSGNEGPAMLRAHFTRMGLSMRDVVALSGAHTLGHASRLAFTPDPMVFSNSYFQALLATPERAPLISDRTLVRDAEFRGWVEVYAADEACWFADFADAFRRLTWLGNKRPPAAG